MSEDHLQAFLEVRLTVMLKSQEGREYPFGDLGTTTNVSHISSSFHHGVCSRMDAVCSAESNVGVLEDSSVQDLVASSTQELDIFQPWRLLLCRKGILGEQDRHIGPNFVWYVVLLVLFIHLNFV